MNRKSIVILALVSYYLPSYKAGGPVKTIQNMVEQLECFQFRIVTRDRDLGDCEAFTNINVSSWERVGNASVMYLELGSLSFYKTVKMLRKAEFDILYLNSFFDVVFTIKPLLARKLGLLKSCPIVLAPRGEFSKGALTIKHFKKKSFIRLASWLRLYEGVTWQASSELEKEDIIREFNVDPTDIVIAKDLPPKFSEDSSGSSLRENEICKIIFLSRISPIKNLEFALRALLKVKSSLIFDVYGPIEDEEYWGICLKLMKALPSNIKANYYGPVTPDHISNVFSGYDLFVFPTLGENYGHVVAESLFVGTPVLLSNQTPWQDLESRGLGWDLPLDLEIFTEKIDQVAKMDPVARLNWRRKVAINGVSLINNKQDVCDNVSLFKFAVNMSNKG